MLKALKYGRVNAASRAVKSELLDWNTYQKLLSARSTGDIFLILKETCYAPFLTGTSHDEIREATRRYFLKKVDTLSRWLESTVLEEFFVKGRKIPLIRKFLKTKELREFSESWIDLVNVLTVAKGKLFLKLKTEEISKELIPGGRFKTLLPELLKATSLDEFSQILKSKIGEFFSLEELRRKVYTYHVSTMEKILLGYPFKESIPFAVLRLKEIELMNLQSIVEGIRFKLERKEIEGMLIALS